MTSPSFLIMRLRLISHLKNYEMNDDEIFANSYVLRRCSDYDPLPDDLRGVITLDAIREARIVINKEGFVRETPIIDGITINGPRKSSKIGHLKSFGMKCENMQFSGESLAT